MSPPSCGLQASQAADASQGHRYPRYRCTFVAKRGQHLAAGVKDRLDYALTLCSCLVSSCPVWCSSKQTISHKVHGVNTVAHLFEPSEVAPMHFFALFMMTSGRLIDTWRGAVMESPASTHNSQSSSRVYALSQHISANPMQMPVTGLCPD